MNRKPSSISFVLIVASLALLLTSSPAFPAAYAQAAKANDVYLPVVLHTHSGTENNFIPLPVPPTDEAARRISVPAGFAIRIFAQGIPKPRLMTIGPDGWVYVALMNTGQVARLPDRNADGLADGVEIAADGLYIPHNLEFHDGWMYVAQTGRIDRLADQNLDGVYETKQLVTDNVPGADGQHSTRTLHFGPDGKLYVSAGSSCNFCVESDPRRAAILRFNADGSIPADNPYAGDSDLRKQAVWASGMRNPVDFLWSASGQLWADQNGSDGLGDGVPPEEILIPVQGGKWYGWPYCYTPVLGLNQPTQAEVADPRITPPAGTTCAQSIPGLLTDLAHSAPLGMTSATAARNFPTAYRDDLFVAYHGSWNISDPANYRDCKVQRVVITNGAVVGTQTFANGWRAPGKQCGDPSGWGRPAGVVTGADGALYISDDAGGRVYRVVYTGN